MIPKLILERLVCPRCASPVAEEGPGKGLRCAEGHLQPFRDGYLDCGGPDLGGSTARTLQSFGFEWNAFGDVRDEDERFAEIYFRDLDRSSLSGGVGLDAGCGKGRFTRFVAPYLEALCALDGSSAVEVAARNLADLSQVLVVKSDLRAAPFAEESFDFIMSLGVLHHLDDPRAGFERLLSYLAPGGRVLLYLYSRPPQRDVRAAALGGAALVRRFTVRLSPRALRIVAVPIAAVLYAGVVLPGRIGHRRGWRAAARLPMDTYRDKPFRSVVLDTFDRLGAPVEHRFVWSDLEPWFRDAGLIVEAARDEAGWFVLARKPSGS